MFDFNVGRWDMLFKMYFNLSTCHQDTANIHNNNFCQQQEPDEKNIDSSRMSQGTDVGSTRVIDYMVLCQNHSKVHKVSLTLRLIKQCLLPVDPG